MKKSIVIDEPSHNYGIEKILPIVKDAGFDAVDYGSGCFHDELFAKPDNEIERVLLHDKALLDEYGLEVAQMHAPFPSFPDDPNAFDRMVYNVTHSLRAAQIMGSPYVVTHGALRVGWVLDTDHEATKILNLRILEKILPVAEETGVKLALENMPCMGISTSSPEEIIGIVDAFNSPYLVACLDTGHANMTETMPDEFARVLGPRLKVLHIHDNTCNNDTHLPPFCGNIRWKKFSKALHDIGFSGAFSLETTHLQNHLPFEIWSEIPKVESKICDYIINLWNEA